MTGGLSLRCDSRIMWPPRREETPSLSARVMWLFRALIIFAGRRFLKLRVIEANPPRLSCRFCESRLNAKEV